jgi:S-formylglutathione hydrolase FrmB
VPFAHVSLLQGWFPALLGCLALGALGASVLRWDGRWVARRVLPVAAVSLAAVAVLAAIVDPGRRFDDPIPEAFSVWVAMPVAAIGLAVAGWRRSGPARRVVAVLAIPLTAAFAADLINQYYAYEPTVGALFGADIEHRLPSAELGLAGPPGAAAAPQVRRPGRLGQRPSPPGSAPTTFGGGGPTTTADRAAMVAAGHGFVSSMAIPGTASGFVGRPAYVWVPPAFFAAPRPQLPVVVMLAGVPGEPLNMIRAGGATIAADRYAAAHGGRAPILVFPDANGSFTADSECVDGIRGRAETYLTQDVPAFVESRFSAAAGPAHWGILGYSEGGTCAMDLALGHPEVFGSFVDVAGDAFPNLGTRGDARARAIAGLYGGDTAAFAAHDPLALAQRPQDRGVQAWFEAGARDHRIAAVAHALNTALLHNGLTSRMVLAPGGHDFAMAAHAVADSFAWLAGRLGS